eukprot:TRINITY_DN9275_c0_g1_i1.p1 TRINITY_DN9275_c0_g1~~TRINITY_DN9275_c0_g1_i1.p1  ORF type:complete len:186 (-),score=102.71 TRINITY_DN9275_c0_g1_i1:411-968(-)
MDQPPPELDLAATFKKEAADPSMIAYMKSIGIDPDYVPPKDDPRRVVISGMSVVFKDHPTPFLLKFDTQADIDTAKKHPMVIKEGCEYKLRVSFRVQHNVVLGLKIHNEVKKLGKTLSKDVEMLGTYPPKHDFQHVHIPEKGWAEAPSGMLARGEYGAKMKFSDDDGKSHLEFEYTIKIAKDYSS